MSGRYIDADKFAKRVLEVAYPIVHDINSHEKGLTIFGIAQVLDEQATADVVEVCLCKDCKYRKFIDWGMGDCLHPKGSKHIAYDYHYCSYGERSEENVGD